MGTHIETFAAGVMKSFGAGNFLYVKEAVQEDLTIKFKKHGRFLDTETAELVGKGYKAFPPRTIADGKAFDSVEITSAAGGDFTIFVTEGSATIDSTEISGVVETRLNSPAGLTGNAPITVGTTSTTVINTAGTVEMLLKAAKTNTEQIFITQGAIETGYPLEPGEPMVITTEDAIEAICASGGQKLYRLRVSKT